MYWHTRFRVDSHRSARTLGKVPCNILVFELNHDDPAAVLCSTRKGGQLTTGRQLCFTAETGHSCNLTGECLAREILEDHLGLVSLGYEADRALAETGQDGITLVRDKRHGRCHGHGRDVVAWA